MNTDDDYYQGTWEQNKPEPPTITGRKEGKAPRHFIDVEAFGRLLKRTEAKKRAREAEG